MIREDSEVNKKNDSDSCLFELFVYKDDFYSDSDSDGLAIDENEFQNSPPKSKKRKISKMDPEDKLVLENIEEEIERQLDEKAAKSNMSVANVKNILKHVITNEHVLAMVRQSVNNDSKEDICAFEPKLTRAKAKELLKEQPEVALNWQTPIKKQSEVHILINQELPEDSSDEEYVPVEEESDDDQEHSIFSENDSQPPTPVTPSSVHSMDCATQTSWTEDGIFRVPKVINPILQTEPSENIALRTRSKFSLSDTPLESIEQAFIPPDITTDMYELECDDDDWQKFLTDFTQPLKQVITETVEDDDEADPEYNVLADEEIDIVDKEELRADKGVKVTKRELNDLMAELFDCAELMTPPYPADEDVVKDKEGTSTENIQSISIPAANTPPLENIQESTKSDTTMPSDTSVKYFLIETTPMQMQQKLLFEQQMRQHVQLLTQNFLQTFEHPTYSDLAPKFRKMLIELFALVETNLNSSANVINLLTAINLITFWEQKFIKKEEEAMSSKQFVVNQISRHKKVKGFNNAYVPEFSPLFKKTVSNSTVFMYPNLLPKIPYTLQDRRKFFLDSENQLIAIGLEQFIPYMKSNKDLFQLIKGNPLTKDTAKLISDHMMPFKDLGQIFRQITRKKMKKVDPNPIQYYFIHNKAPLTLHYVLPVNILPPALQSNEKLPYQWQHHIKVETQENLAAQNNYILLNSANLEVSYPKQRFVKIKSKPVLRKLKGVSIKNNINKSKYIEKIKNKHIVKVVDENNPSAANENTSNLISLSKVNQNKKLKDLLNADIQTQSIKMLPSMPFLSTPIKELNTSKEQEKQETRPEDDINQLDISNTVNLRNENQTKTLNLKDDCTSQVTTVEAEDSEVIDKDNEDDIRTLMIASSTIKIKTRKPQLSTGEKKKTKIQREYEAMTTLLMPEDPKLVEEKANNYAQAYFHKVQERLSIDNPDDYNEFLATLSEHDESSDSVSDLYNKVESILSPKHPDLCEEFITFLTPAQAKQIGKLIPHSLYDNMATFLKKLEIYFSKQPAQIRKIYNTLAELGGKEDVNIDTVKNNIIPLLKGNQLLIEYFQKIFFEEKPPESLMTVWENLNCDTVVKPNEEVFEEIIVPDLEDPYGGNNCICTCHKKNDELFKSRARHCIPCGTKFIQGRVFIQSVKGPRPASVTFPGASMVEQYKRLSIKSPERPKRRSETASPTKNLIASPVKISQNESEDDEHSQAKSFKNSPKPPRVNKSPKSASKRIIKVRNIDSKTLKSDINVVTEDNLSESVRMTPLTISVPPVNSDCYVIPKRMSPRFQPQVNSPLDTITSPFSSPTRDSKKKITKVSFLATEPDIRIQKDTIVSDISEDKKTKQEMFEFISGRVELETTDIPESEDCNTSIESIELKLSPNHSIESVDMCEESSQDTSVCQDEMPALCSDGSEDSSLAESIHSDCCSPILEHSEDSTNNIDEINNDIKDSQSKHLDMSEGCSSISDVAQKNMSWTREEDRIILKTFQQECDSENIFEKIRQLIPQRTVTEIRQRFQTLMSLLEKITENT